ncbi:Maf family nucleotide pyrophosphatase [Capnocytophaga canimorsus]|uniref:dTTP/UTP pyrophosphatase n=2 Tax=Capnocytophaga canimorsus TaxID=28188 RepID=F9YQX5_CAPCC|nr:Maf family nucleotide pyrophosphatase [Capnocytophaga canimorsus]AEK23585.1 Maf-like protein [Capnocytophaga canimorsus Cc5]ATA76600.1 septum formation protein Maf [Capnocytophaga canimorsus]ATA91209.1 septum formation protein Maf [Capnocytophaga canimorsus]ATA93323.1 septum formation protein Maf [Capnocytophaga canimorsus]MDT9499368.1 septum formation protein Maf [Capnocytophaga canimorsus]
MLYEKIKNYHIILASASPRRQQFLKDLLIDFDVVIKPVEETYPKHLTREEITEFLVKKKAEPFKNTLTPTDILITSDTIVWCEDKALGKPQSHNEAKAILSLLSDKQHEVITSVGLTTSAQQMVLTDTTKVTLRKLSDAEINFYIEKYMPYDKAGAYGIQDWIGSVGVTSIQGSYNNVMGLPTHLLYNALNTIIT